MNLRRFNIYFKQKKLGSIRRSSIHTEYNVLDPMREDHHYVNMNLKDNRKLDWLCYYFRLNNCVIFFDESREKKVNRNERFEGY